MIIIIIRANFILSVSSNQTAHPAYFKRSSNETIASFIGTRQGRTTGRWYDFFLLAPTAAAAIIPAIKNIKCLT